MMEAMTSIMNGFQQQQQQSTAASSNEVVPAAAVVYTFNEPKHEVKTMEEKLKHLDPKIASEVTNVASTFGKHVERWVKIQQKLQKTDEALEEFNNDKYPSFVKEIKMDQHCATLDNQLLAAEDNDTEFTVKTEKGTTRREAIEKAHIRFLRIREIAQQRVPLGHTKRA